MDPHWLGNNIFWDNSNASTNSLKLVFQTIMNNRTLLSTWTQSSVFGIQGSREDFSLRSATMSNQSCRELNLFPKQSIGAAAFDFLHRAHPQNTRQSKLHNLSVYCTSITNNSFDKIPHKNLIEEWKAMRLDGNVIEQFRRKERNLFRKNIIWYAFSNKHAAVSECEKFQAFFEKTILCSQSETLRILKSQTDFAGNLP